MNGLALTRIGMLLALLASSVRPAFAEPQSPLAPEGTARALRLSGLVQADWRIWSQSSEDSTELSSGAPLNEERFELRRARLRATAESKRVASWVEVDANSVEGPEIRPFEAIVLVGWPEALSGARSQLGALGELGREQKSTVEDDARELSSAGLLQQEFERHAALSAGMGLLPLPFGYEARQTATARPVLERALFSRAFFGAHRDLGAVLHARYRFVNLSAALVNGEPLGTEQAELLDLTSSKDILGRLGLSFGRASGLRIEAGVSWLSGRGLSPGQAATKDNLVWVDDNENGLVEVVELSPAPGQPARASNSFGRSALGGDVQLSAELPRLGSFHLWAEIVRARNLDRTVQPADPVSAGRDLRHLGWAVGVSQQVFGHWEAALRYDRYDPDSDATRLSVLRVVPLDPSTSTLSGTLSARLQGARLLAQYDHEDNSLGRTRGGAPTRLQNDRFTLRAEYVLR